MREALAVLLLALANFAYGQDTFQQEVEYAIKVELDDQSHFIHGSLSLNYINNSPEVLDTLWLHLWPNGYKNRFSRMCSQKVGDGDFDFYFAPHKQRGYIDSLQFESENAPLKWGYHPELIDVAYVIPPFPLGTGDELSMSTPFRVKIPSGRFSRLGHIGQSYQMTQWYPKFAVYDDEGWHIMPYLTQGEFFSEFGTYDVSITVPENYTVGATGILQNEEERKRLEKLANAPLPDTLSNAFPPSADEKKTLRFVQDRVHDFAWFADKRYIVRNEQFILPESGREITAWSMFTPRNANTWEESTTYLKEATLTYGKWVGEYPYDHITAVDGTISAGGGMEYPMITVIGQSAGKFGLDVVISHEAGHNWFYGILASNERDHPWLDEGLNSFVEMVHMMSRYDNLGMVDGIADLALGDAHERKQGYRYQNELIYQFQARRGKDQPLCLHSEGFTPTNYGAMVYMKTALVFDYLLAYLGEERFIRCMNTYYNEWKFNHPGPEDIRNVFERESGENLSWFFDGFVATDKKFDPKALSLKDKQFEYRLSGDIMAPFPVTAFKGDEILGTEWVRPTAKNGIHELPWQDADRVAIDYSQHTLDIDRSNNAVRSYGIFKRSVPTKFKFLLGFERAERKSIFYNIGGVFNTADGISLGPVVANYLFPSKRTEAVIAPMYAFGSQDLIGGFRVDHHFDRKVNWARGLSFALTGRRSGTIGWEDRQMGYNKLTLGIRQELQPNKVKKAINTRLGLRGIWVEEQLQVSTEQFDLTTSKDRMFYEFTLNSSRTKGLNPFSANVNFLTDNNTFARVDLTANWNIVLNDQNDRVTFRLFAGQFLYADENSLDFDGRVAYRSSGMGGLSGFRGSPQEFLYDGTFIGRDQRGGVYASQFIDMHGGLHTPTQWGNSTDYMFGFGVDLDIPVGFPLVAYVNTLVTPTRPPITSGGEIPDFEPTFGYDAGLGIRVARDVFEIWFPLAFSTDIRESYESLDIDFSERIRFTLNLNKVNPATLIRKIDP